MSQSNEIIDSKRPKFHTSRNQHSKKETCEPGEQLLAHARFGYDTSSVVKRLTSFTSRRCSAFKRTLVLSSARAEGCSAAWTSSILRAKSRIAPWASAWSLCNAPNTVLCTPAGSPALSPSSRSATALPGMLKFQHLLLYFHHFP